MAHPKKAQSWLVQEHENGTWSIEHGNRSFTAGHTTQQEAMSVLGKHHVSGERVYLGETDGYRTEITRALARAKVIKSVETAGSARREAAYRARGDRLRRAALQARSAGRRAWPDAYRNPRTR